MRRSPREVGSMSRHDGSRNAFLAADTAESTSELDAANTDVISLSSLWISD